MTRIIGEYVEFIYCYCGCGKTRASKDRWGAKHYFLKGHNNRGRKFSEETLELFRKQRKGKFIGKLNPFYGKKLSEEQRKKLRESLLGKYTNEKNKSWKGDNAGYSAIHIWVRKYLPKPELCIICNLVVPREVSNISGNYIRDLKDWQWVCHRCHMHYDNVPQRLLLARKRKRELPKSGTVMLNDFFE